MPSQPPLIDLDWDDLGVDDIPDEAVEERKEPSTLLPAGGAPPPPNAPAPEAPQAERQAAVLAPSPPAALAPTATRTSDDGVALGRVAAKPKWMRTSSSGHAPHALDEGSSPFGSTKGTAAPPPLLEELSAETAGAVLVVDPDGVSRRFVELAIGATARGLTVETARDIAEALEVMKRVPIDLAVCETALPDGSGLSLMRRMTRQRRFERVPFVFFTSESKIPGKVAAFRAGACDYICKPCNPEELGARIDAILTRFRDERRRSGRRDHTLAGDFSTMPFPDLMMMLEMSRASGILSVVTRFGTGLLVLHEGSLRRAEYRSVLGPDAIYALMSHGSGRFEFTGGLHSNTVEANVDEPITALLMEGVRRIDEGDIRRTSPGMVHPTATAPKPPPLTRPRDAAMSPGSMEAYRELIEDPFTVGDLLAFNETTLKAWTRSETVGERLHILLVAELGAGVGALLGWASSPSEQWVIDALAPDPKVMGLAFDLAGGRLVDLLLLDASNPGAFRSGLLRRPDVVVVAPPRGDFLSMGIRGRAELDGMVANMSPSVVVSVGNRALGKLIDDFSSVRDGQVGHVAIEGLLGDRGSDLRAAISAGLDFGRRRK